jgi:hypothetical protein
MQMLPGFTADASLHNVDPCYIANGVVFSTRAGIVPQLLRVGAGLPNALMPRAAGTAAFQCGWNSQTLTSECTCAGDEDCNRMFTSGFCGGNASCDTGAGTCRCDLQM